MRNSDFGSIVEEEADETLFWLELIKEMEIVDKTLLNSLMQENNEIIAIIVSSIKTARNNKQIRNPNSAIRNQFGTK